MNIHLLQSETIASFAEKLLCSQPFIDKNCTLLMDVPIKCLHYRRPIFSRANNLNTMSAADGNTTLDFVICSNSDVLLGIALEVTNGESTSPLQTYLPDVPLLTFPAFSLACLENDTGWDDFYCKVIQLLENLKCKSDYSVDGVSLNMSTAELVRRNLLCSSDVFSPYGHDSGLFFKFGTDDNHQVTKIICTTQSYMSKLSNIASMSDASASPQAALLDNLLDMTLADLFHIDCDEVLRWKYQLEECQYAPVNSPDAIPIRLDTYADLLYAMMEIHFAEPNFIMLDDPNRIAWTSTVHKTALLLRSFAQELCAMSLKDYFTACTQLRENNYALWVFQTRFASLLNTAECSANNCTVGDMLAFLATPDPVCTDETFKRESLLVDLLLQPIFQYHF